MKFIKQGLAATGLVLVMATSLLAAPADAAAENEPGFRPVIAQMEAFLQAHHFNRDELEGEGYDAKFVAF